ncbi:MAG TPA: segregation/condensation protein A [Acidimicrobiales bacterium]|nr:segregation/condensation protein A [Acidimicrobiales bacterium]
MPGPAAALDELRQPARYSVTTPVFEGPLDLLLHLVASQQVELYEVSLVAIVDGYLAHLAQLEALDLDVATEFVVIAATLIELKSRRLLPPSEQPDDDDLDLWAERDLLLARLIECKTFKNAAQRLSFMADLAATSWPRRAGLEERFASLVPDVLAGVTVADLQAALVRAVTPAPPPSRVDLRHVAPVRITAQEMAEQLAARLAGAGRLTFRELTAGLADRLEVIVAFLAVLELYKDGRIDVDQPGRFGDLVVTWAAR